MHTIENYTMLENVNSVCVGVSGGADSFCLLHILKRLSNELNFKIKAVHVNHQIRGEEALRDQTAVQNFCKTLDVELIIIETDVPKLAADLGISLEQCGRQVRYEAFAAQNCDAVAVAHSLSDSIETMIFNLVRGTALKGLCGIPAIRQPNIIRPLIECTREEIEQYCKENSIDYVTDSTNLSDDYTRNFIRNNIISLFSNVNSNYQTSISRCLDSLEIDNDFLDTQASLTLEKARYNDGYKASIILAEHEAIINRVIAKIIEDKLNKPVETRHIKLVKTMLESEKGKIELTKDLYICLNSDIISFYAYVNIRQAWSVKAQLGLTVTPVANFKIEQKTLLEVNTHDYTNMIDLDKLTGELNFRSRLEADKFSNPKRKVSKSLKKLFNEQKIPPEQRNSIAILSCDNQIVWIDGFGVDDKFKITEKTKNIYIVKKEGTFKND